MSSFHPLTVASVHDECRDTRTIRFDVTEGLAPTFRWTPGQHLTVRVRVAGQEHRRAYTISSAGRLQITVRRVERGRVSHHLHGVEPGAVLDVMPPFGAFCLPPSPRERRTHYFYAAGSGITPLMAMIEGVLAAEPASSAALLYGNRDDRSAIFADALTALVARHPGRLKVRHVHSRPRWFASHQPWRRGRIDRAAVRAFIDAHPPDAQDTRHWVCGPGSMNRTVRAALLDLDVSEERVRAESYGDETVPVDLPGIAAALRIRGVEGHLDDQPLPVAAGQTLLQAARAADADVRWSCEAGVCGACRCRVTEGAVVHRAHMALTEAEVAAGHALACQALPASPRVAVHFDRRTP